MAERRMFSKSIVESDAFLDMPVTARLLYFTLGMEADDDGFINAPKKAIRYTGCSNDDLKILIAKKFIIPFESGVIVIKHWKINNYIQKDRYKPTQYEKELSHLYLKQNNAYTLNQDSTTRPALLDNKLCIQNGYKLYTQDSIDKDSIDKDSIDKDSIDKDNSEKSQKSQPSNFFNFLNIYPSNKIDTNKEYLEKIFNEIVTDQDTWEEIAAALPVQINSKDWHNENGKYIPYASNYLKYRKWKSITQPPVNNSNRFLSGPYGSVTRY